MKSELEEHYSEFKDVFDVLPVNTVANRKKRIQYLGGRTFGDVLF